MHQKGAEANGQELTTTDHDLRNSETSLTAGAGSGLRRKHGNCMSCQ
jgi:hypothetical protein